MSAGILTLCGLCLGMIASSPAIGQEAEPRASQQAISNVVDALDAVPSEGRLLQFQHGPLKLAPGGHFQGIQIRRDALRQRNIVFLSHDSETVAYLMIVEFPWDLLGEGRVIHVHTFPNDGKSPPLRHAGGIQLLGNVLAVGLEDNQEKTRSEIQFWDVSDPTLLKQLTHLTVRRSGTPKDKTAGGVGIVRREQDCLLAVANWDSRAVDFYVSNHPQLDDPKCQFEFRARWQHDQADKVDWQPDSTFGAYQAINLVADAKQDIYLLGFDTSPTGKDLVDLFTVELNRDPKKLLRKTSTKPMRLQGDNHFRYSGGIWFDDDRLAILSSERSLNPLIRLNIAIRNPR